MHVWLNEHQLRRFCIGASVFWLRSDIQDPSQLLPSFSSTCLRCKTRIAYPGEHALFILNNYKTTRPTTGRIEENNQNEQIWEMEVTEHYYNYWLLEVDKIHVDWLL